MNILINSFNQIDKEIKYEKDLYWLWINFCNQKKYYKKEKLKGINPGILNELEGPDFQGAEFELNGKIYRGDVEIHRECNDWKRHGHHLDPRYDKVVLHLVYTLLADPVYNSKNQLVPSISMNDIPVSNYFNNCITKCHLNSFNFEIPNSIYQRLALNRMTTKANEIFNLISSYGMDQSLYLLLLKSLGNTRNNYNYERLAQIIPWKLVYILKRNNHPPEFWLALYYGASGFLSNNKNDVLKKYWKSCLPLLEGIPLNKANWKFGGIRPNNYPQKRLAGLAEFIWQLKDPSLYNEIEKIFYQRYPTKKTISMFIELFKPKENIIMQNVHLGTNYFFGKNLIVEFIGNIFIPLFYKMSILNQSKGFEVYLKQLFFELPPVEKYGKLKSLYYKLNISKINKNYYYINQALLYLQKNFCEFNLYQECPMSLIAQKN